MYVIEILCILEPKKYEKVYRNWEIRNGGNTRLISSYKKQNFIKYRFILVLYNRFNKNYFLEQSRCSHFKSVCYFALSLSKKSYMFLGVQCTESCDMVILPTLSNRIDFIPMGLQTPEW